MYRIDHSYEEYMSPCILPVCVLPQARPRGVTANVEDIRVQDIYSEYPGSI